MLCTVVQRQDQGIRVWTELALQAICVMIVGGRLRRIESLRRGVERTFAVVHAHHAAQRADLSEHLINDELQVLSEPAVPQKDQVLAGTARRLWAIVYGDARTTGNRSRRSDHGRPKTSLKDDD